MRVILAGVLVIIGVLRGRRGSAGFMMRCFLVVTGALLMPVAAGSFARVVTTAFRRLEHLPVLVCGEFLFCGTNPRKIQVLSWWRRLIRLCRNA